METTTITTTWPDGVPRIPIDVARVLADVPYGTLFTKLVGRPARALPHRRSRTTDFVCRADKHVRVLTAHQLIELDGDVYKTTELGERTRTAYARQSPQVTVTRVAG